MINQTIDNLRQLKMSGMVTALNQQQEQPSTYEGLSFIERLNLLLEHECLDREHRKQQRLISAAKLKLNSTPQDIDYQHPRGLKQSQVASLLVCDWLSKGQNLLVTGPCGSGKTYIACALGHQACLKGFSVKYFRISRLLLNLTQAKADGTYQRLLKNIAKVKLLILDDWGLESLKASQRNDLLEIMEDRYNLNSTVVISQLPTDTWHQSIGDNTLADAILDRLMHNAHRINLKGESMRKTIKS
ncbi:hypothetical protein ND16A_0970 [Thalassotalea sp. ND16A]|nr:hypothetical protein ND16A_0970 [Thalassotalea sp. ND16A]